MLRFIDSFDHLDTASLPTKWPTLVGSPVIAAGYGRHAQGLCAPFGAVAATSVARRDLNPDGTVNAHASWALGVGVMASLSGLNSPSVLALLDGTAVQLAVAIDPTRTLSVRRGDGTVLGTTSSLLALGTYVYVELEATVHASAGAVRLALDGVTVLSLTSAVTQSTGAATADGWRLGTDRALSAVTTIRFDDFYAVDGQGALHTGALGRCRVDCTLPDGDTVTDAMEWTGSVLGGHWAMVDEVPPNGDADYVATAVTSALELHQLQTAAPGPQALFGVQLCLTARQETGSGQVLIPTLRASETGTGAPTTQASATPISLTSAWALYPSIWETNPATASAWTDTQVNASWFGEAVP